MANPSLSLSIARVCRISTQPSSSMANAMCISFLYYTFWRFVCKNGYQTQTLFETHGFAHKGKNTKASPALLYLKTLLRRHFLVLHTHVYQSYQLNSISGTHSLNQQPARILLQSNRLIVRSISTFFTFL